jgi:hypothetical protein
LDTGNCLRHSGGSISIDIYSEVCAIVKVRGPGWLVPPGAVKFGKVNSYHESIHRITKHVWRRPYYRVPV